MSSQTHTAELKKIVGFETTDYAYLHGNIVWSGTKTTTDHPRNYFSNWQPESLSIDTDKLIAGAHICRTLFQPNRVPNHVPNRDLAAKAKGLLLWLNDLEMAFPLNLAESRFNDIQSALMNDDLNAFTAASIRVLGLGHGLTPSGDDFVGGMLFAFAHSPRLSWAEKFSAEIEKIHHAALTATNVISAALLDDMMLGKSYRALHDVLIALQTTEIAIIQESCEKLLALGASSGADMLAGLLLALTSNHKTSTIQHTVAH